MFAAASLTDAFTEAAAAFEEANPGATVTLNFGASSALAQQINEKAPGRRVRLGRPGQHAEGRRRRRHRRQPEVFATNSLEIIVAPGNPEGITGLADLLESGLIYVTAAPEVPDRQVRRPGPREGGRDREPDRASRPT